jgi:hypothetical protein
MFGPSGNGEVCERRNPVYGMEYREEAFEVSREKREKILA